MTPPFVDAKMPEVCARVAFRLVQKAYKNEPRRDMSGAEYIILTLAICDPLRGSLVHSALLAALFAQRKGIALRSWRDFAITASRCGKGFRHCWYAEYKATRRDPRVTNRGVTTSKVATDHPSAYSRNIDTREDT